VTCIPGATYIWYLAALHSLLIFRLLLETAASSGPSENRRNDDGSGWTNKQANGEDLLFNSKLSGETMAPVREDRVCIVGSGNWGSAISLIIGRNCAQMSPWFEAEVKMWVFEEEVDYRGQTWKLSQLINAHHENTKYLPGTRLPENIVAEPNLETACRDATVLVIVLPHQFLPKLLPQIRKVVHPSCRCISLIKGLGTLEQKCAIVDSHILLRMLTTKTNDRV
jgi:NAD-dependent glycerol-3-phosphate dehydrogenase N-terminus